MLQQKSVRELKELLISLKSKLEKMKPNEKADSPLFSEEDKLILRSDAPEIEKKKWVISKILRVRINLFSEYLKQIYILEEKKNLDEAVKLMKRLHNESCNPLY